MLPLHTEEWACKRPIHFILCCGEWERDETALTTQRESSTKMERRKCGIRQLQKILRYLKLSRSCEMKVTAIGCF